LVESAFTNLQNLAIAVAFQSPILLEGPIGCGKTTLIEYLAAVTGRTKPPHILKVQLGDQTDSKVTMCHPFYLSYVSSGFFLCFLSYAVDFLH